MQYSLAIRTHITCSWCHPDSTRMGWDGQVPRPAPDSLSQLRLLGCAKPWGDIRSCTLPTTCREQKNMMRCYVLLPVCSRPVPSGTKCMLACKSCRCPSRNPDLFSAASASAQHMLNEVSVGATCTVLHSSECFCHVCVGQYSKHIAEH